MNPRSSSKRPLATMLLVAIATIALAACGGSSSKAAETPTTQEQTTTTTARPTTTTTVDPGTLPQTDEKPTGTGTEFDARMKVLADAIINNSPDSAISTFFPVTAYKQTKKNTDPAADWNSRLIKAFREDVADTAAWIKPGVEYNVGPYWRVFKTQMNFTVDGKNVQIPIESMISWRGQWYVVHLGTIR